MGAVPKTPTAQTSGPSVRDKPWAEPGSPDPQGCISLTCSPPGTSSLCFEGAGLGTQCFWLGVGWDQRSLRLCFRRPGNSCEGSRHAWGWGPSRPLRSQDTLGSGFWGEVPAGLRSVKVMKERSRCFFFSKPMLQSHRAVRSISLRLWLPLRWPQIHPLIHTIP